MPFYYVAYFGDDSINRTYLQHGQTHSYKDGKGSRLQKQGRSYPVIAEELKASYEGNRGDLYPHSPPGRPPMSALSQRYIYLDLLRHPYGSFEHIGLDHGVSATTVRKIANAHCLYRFISKSKPVLTTRAWLERIKWASEVKEQDWTSVIFTDESMVKIGDKGRRCA